MKIFDNIKVRLTLWFLLIAVVLVVFFGFVSFAMLSDGLSRNTVYPWDMRTGVVRMQPDGSGKVTSLSDVTGRIGMEWNDDIMLVRQFSRSELLSGEGTVEVTLPDYTVVSVERNLLAHSNMSGEANIWLYVLYSESAEDDYRLLVVDQSTGSISYALEVFKNTIIIAAVVTLLLAALLSFFLVSRMLRPVRVITRTAQEIEGNNLDKRLGVRSNDELGRLASTLNQMFGRLEAAFIREREFTADASHELRTPLAIAQGEATLALRQARSPEEYQKALEAISRQISRVSSIINRLLFLARSDDRLELVMSNVNLKLLLSEIVSDAQVLCEQKNITLDSTLDSVPDDLLVRGDATRLEELFLNLLDNAVRYTPEGGQITVTLAREGNAARIAITDTGQGIPEEQIPNIFNRFYRVDKTRSRAEGGAGLGLAISKRIAEIHRGSIEVESEAGKGSTFTVYLPLER